MGEFIAGESGLYELQVLNFGPSDAGAAVRITDTLPDGLTFSSVTSTSGAWGCSTAGQVLTCIRGGGSPRRCPGPAPNPETLTLMVAIAANLPVGAIANTATITSPTPDPVPDNNTDGDLTGTDTLADLSIVKTVEPDPVTAGEQVTYTLQVANGGPSVARQLITVTDVLPAGLSWAGSWQRDRHWLGRGYTDADRMVTCTRDQDLAAPDSPTDDPIESPPITLDLDVDPDAGPATIVNSATVKSPTNDPDRPTTRATSRSRSSMPRRSHWPRRGTVTRSPRAPRQHSRWWSPTRAHPMPTRSWCWTRARWPHPAVGDRGRLDLCGAGLTSSAAD